MICVARCWTAAEIIGLAVSRLDAKGLRHLADSITMKAKQSDPERIPPPTQARWLAFEEWLSGVRSKFFGARSSHSAPTPYDRFRRILETAKGIAEVNPRGLPGLVRGLLRPMQSEYLLGVAELGQDPYPRIDALNFFGPAMRPYFFEHGQFRVPSLRTEAYRLQLNRDIVLPWPWSVGSYEGALATIGSEKNIPDRKDYLRSCNGPWTQGDNHQVELWLPWGIGFVSCGNHSIAAGILAGEGVLTPSDVRDMGYLFDEVLHDGHNFLDLKTSRVLGPAPSWRLGAVFEIGRLMREHGLLAPPALLMAP